MRRALALWSLAATVVAVAAGGAFAPGRAEAITPGKSVLINVVGWDGDQFTGAAPLSSIPSDPIRAYWNNHVVDWFRSASSGEFGGLTLATGIGQYTISTPHSDNPSPFVTVCDHQFLSHVSDGADAHARASGVNPGDYDIVVYYWAADTPCQTQDGDDFRSSQDGKRLYFQGDLENEAPMREVGHALGLPSAESLHCTDSASHPVTLSSDCFRDPQGDVWDLLGNGTGVFSAGNLNSLGWLIDRAETVQACDCALHRTLQVLSEHGTRLGIVLQDGQDGQGRPARYWLEYRQPTGLDAPGFNGTTRFPEPEAGLIVHREVPGETPGSAPIQQLLDMTPDGDFARAALPVGRTWTNPLGTMKVTLDSTDDVARTASITISTQNVQVPDVHYDDLAGAAKALADAGLSHTLAAPTIDVNCNNIDGVLTQSPAQGTYVKPGAPVTISLGRKDPDRPCPARRRYLVVNVGWANQGTTNGSPLAPSKPIFTFLHGRMNAWFNDASYGKFAGFDFTDGGSYAIETPRLDIPDRTCGDDFQDDVFDRARDAVEGHGIDPGAFDGLVVNWSGEICRNFNGVWRHDGVLLQAGAARSGVAMHEFGHALGLVHSGSLTCTGPGGIPVALSNTCTQSEYGDVFSPMGFGMSTSTGLANAYTASHLAQLGWLDGRFDTVVAQDPAAIHKVLMPLADPSLGTHAVKLVDGPTTLWIEYRQPVGVDAWGYNNAAAGGLVVHREIAKTGGDTALLLDLQPESGSARYDLAVARTWANPLGTMKITLDSVDAAGAHITIASQMATVPDVRNLSLAQARAAIEGAGFAWGGTSQTLTSNCELIGAIVGQSPTGGTRQPAGTTVTPSLGVLDPRRTCK